MIKIDADIIRSWSWDCTIGQGLVGDNFPDEPDEDMLRSLRIRLGRTLTPADEAAITSEWREREMEQTFP